MNKSVMPRRLEEALRNEPDAQLIDVRTPAEYREVHVKGARNVPLDRLDPSDFPPQDKSSIFFICHSGSRGEMARRKLEASGVYAANVEGGTSACIETGLPIVRGERTMSLERQVRIAAGSLVVLSVALATLAHPYWIGLAGFVGAGLVFAGVTDTCGMGMLLARMPWNQAGGCAEECSD